MKEFLIHYYISDQKNEPRTLVIKAKTLQDATVKFNTQHSKCYTLVYIEENQSQE